MDPMTLAIIMAGLGGLSSIYGATRKVPELESDYWKKWYDPARIEATMGPLRSVLTSREQEAQRELAEQWGSGGLVSSAGARAGRQAISRKTERLLTEALASTRMGEMERASGLGLSQFQRDLQKAMSERAAYSQLASILMSPAAMGLGQKLGYGKPIPPTPPNWATLPEIHWATLPEIPKTDIYQNMLDILRQELGR